ncbi:MAG: DUF2029 domain-containing protein [Anaerolineales bacterium]|nr:DUF2029 domain-containing protein [Anaerolineales bacterium]
MYRYRSTFLFAALVLISLLGLAGLTWANYRFSDQSSGGNDFLARWVGARKWLIEGISPYDERVSLATQEIIYGHPADVSKGEDLSHFVYPLTSMVIFGPFGLLEYLPARALWMTVLELSLAGLAILSLRLVRWSVSPARVAVLILFSVLWYHGARTLIVGQFAAIEALLIVGALLLIQKEQDGFAGLLLALATAKPQMVVLIIPFVLIWAYSRRRTNLIWGFFGSLLGMFLVSLFFIPNWPLQMIWQMMEYPGYTERIGSLISILAGSIPGLSKQLSIILNLFFWGYLIVEWVLAWGKDQRWFLWTALMTLVLTNFLVLRTATTNYVMMLPAVFMVFRVLEYRWPKVGVGIVWATLLLLLIGLWALFLNTVQGNLEQPAMYLPLPLFCLLGLWWVRWWAIRPPLMPIENLVE